MGMGNGLRSLILAHKDIFSYGEFPLSTKNLIFMIDKITPGKTHIPYGFHSDLQEMYKKWCFHTINCAKGAASQVYVVHTVYKHCFFEKEMT